MSLTKNNYSFFILVNNKPIIPDENREFKLKHASEYKIKIINHKPDLRCDAFVHIDGKLIGVFRIEKNQQIIIERPVEKARKFTFYKIDSEEAKLGNLHIKNPELGEIKIELKSEAINNFISYTYGYDEVDCTIGGTALSSESKQRFCKAPSMKIEEISTIIIGKLILDNSDKFLPVIPL